MKRSPYLDAFVPARHRQGGKCLAQSVDWRRIAVLEREYPVRWSYANLGIGLWSEMDIRSGLRYEGVKLTASMQGPSEV